jgi:hypothetical protein
MALDNRMTDELGRIYKEAVLFEKLPGGTEDDYRYLSQDSQYPGSDSNRGPPKYKYRALPLDQPV